MRQVWYIYWNAPVDEESREFFDANIQFDFKGDPVKPSPNFNLFRITSGIGSDVRLYYCNTNKEDYNIGVADFSNGDSGFQWNYEGLGLDTSTTDLQELTFYQKPTGQLLAWLQKNGYLIEEIDDTHVYQDLHLSDVDLNTQFKQYMTNGQYEAALAILQNDQLTDKTVIAELFNYVTGRIVEVQSTSDPTFKQDKIQVATTPPSGMVSGQVYFQLKE